MQNILSLTVKNKEIVRSLYYRKTMSCAAISSQVELSIPSVQKFLNELTEAGVVTENGVGISSGGRRPATYSLVADIAYIVTVAMDRFNTRIVLTDMQGDFKTPVQEFRLELYHNPDATEILIAQIRKLISNCGIDPSRIIAAGIAMPGFIDEDRGINFNYLPVKGDQTLKELMEEQLNLPVFLFNDSHAVAQAELKFGLGKTYTDLMVVNIGWGVGLGMILNGKIYNGSSGLAGEFSHIPLVSNGKLCTCGKHGCLETVASMIAIEQKAAEMIADRSTSSSLTIENEMIKISQIIEEAQKGDSFSIRLLSEAGYYIGQGLSILIHIMNPQVIVLSGIGANAGKLWIAPMQQAINEHSIPRLSSFTELTLSYLGADAELIGAASFVMEHIGKISPPVAATQHLNS